MQEWYAGRDQAVETADRADALQKTLETAGPEDPKLKALYELRSYFTKPCQWMIGGDGWAYDIGYGGLDHVLSLKENVNVLVLDSEVYSNTGGQMSKSTPIGTVAQFAAGGKHTPKKNLGLMAMSYGYIYVAQVSMGADKNQTLKAFLEAEAYDGPSLIIAYAPCINHGIYSGMGNSQEQARKAVEVGYWNLFRYNPDLAKKGQNPFILDSREPKGDSQEFLRSEAR